VDNGVGDPVEQEFTLIVNTAPPIISITPNGNIGSLTGNQHSRIASLVVVFNQAVELDTGAMTIACTPTASATTARRTAAAMAPCRRL
jgi:hypothetical protein